MDGYILERRLLYLDGYIYTNEFLMAIRRPCELGVYSGEGRLGPVCVLGQMAPETACFSRTVRPDSTGRLQQTVWGYFRSKRSLDNRSEITLITFVPWVRILNSFFVSTVQYFNIILSSRQSYWYDYFTFPKSNTPIFYKILF